MRADGTIFVSHSFQGTCRRFLGVQLGGVWTPAHLSSGWCPQTNHHRTSPSHTRCPPREAPLHHHFVACSCKVHGTCTDVRRLSVELTVWAQACRCRWTWRSLAGRGWSRGWRSPGSTWASHTGAGKTTGAATHSTEGVER